MPLWTKIISLLCCILLAACARNPRAIAVQDASIGNGALELRSDWQPDAQVLDALDHGIALSFAIRVRARAPSAFGWERTVAQCERHVQLRYFPLVRAYQLRDEDTGNVRNYRVRAQALAALATLRLPLPDWHAPQARDFDVRIRLDRDALPGALRLPALVFRAWRVDSADYAWQTPA